MLASELELPTFDHTDPELRGERYQEAMAALWGQVKAPLGLT